MGRKMQVFDNLISGIWKTWRRIESLCDLYKLLRTMQGSGKSRSSAKIRCDLADNLEADRLRCSPGSLLSCYRFLRRLNGNLCGIAYLLNQAIRLSRLMWACIRGAWTSLSKNVFILVGNPHGIARSVFLCSKQDMSMERLLVVLLI